jgi:hypothetical protein
VSTTLQTYITDLQRLLHDPNNQMWSVQEMTDYINGGRNRVAADTKALRTLVTSISLTAQVDNYNVAATVTPGLPTGQGVVDVMGISVYWGNTRYKLGYQPYTRLDAFGRPWTNNYQRPEIFTRFGALTVYVAPIPDQNYVTDWDVAVTPAAMVNTTDPEVMPYPFTVAVKYHAAWLAKFKEQQLGEAKIFYDAYRQEMRWSCQAFMQRVIPNPYAM